MHVHCMSLQDILGVDAFSSSDEAFAAEELFEAYKTADAGAILKVVASKPSFMSLDNQVIPSITWVM